MKNKKRIILIFIVVMIIALLIWFIIKSNTEIAQTYFSTETYSVTYDSTWEITQSSDSSVEFKHKDTNSLINISIAELDTSLYGKTLEQIADTVKSKIEQENENQNFLKEETITLNDNIGEVYELLFEDGENQSMILVGMHGYTVFISNYTAKNSYFDILLDSVQTINSNFYVTDKTVELTDLDEIETTGITFESGEESYDNVNEYELYGTYYYVKYTIPEEYKLSNTNSSSSTYKISDTGSIDCQISSKNIYEEIDELEEEINSYDYSNVQIDKVTNGDFSGYCYKYEKYTKECATFMYAIDNYNCFIIEISMNSENITQELVDSIKVTEYTKCFSDINRTSENGYLTGKLYNLIWNFIVVSESYTYVNYKVPDKYTEVSWNSDLNLQANFYDRNSARMFVIGKLRNDEITKSDYWDTMNFYDYNIEIFLSGNSKEKEVEYIENGTYQGEVTYNGRNYSYYAGSYDSEGTIIYEAYLLTEIEDSQSNVYTYEIYVTSLDTISIEVLQDFTLIEVKEVESLE